MTSSAVSSGTRTAIPSANVSAEFVGTAVRLPGGEGAPAGALAQSLGFENQRSAGFQVVVYALRQLIAGSPLSFPAR